MAENFVHLHVHSEYSLLDGLGKIHKSSALFDHLKELDMDTIALTDHGVMYGAIEFYKGAKKEGIKPIIGMEAYITNVDLNFEGDKKQIINYHLLLLAKDIEGYRNLMKLTSIAHIQGFYRRPRIDRKTLEKYSKGLICTSACAQGEVARALVEDDHQSAKKAVKWYLDVFEDDYYLEVQKHEYAKYAENAAVPEIRNGLLEQAEAETKINEGVFKLSREFGIPIIATNDAHYIKREDAKAQDTLVCVATGKNVSDVKRLRFIDAPSYHIAGKAEMEDLFFNTPEVLKSTVEVAEKCNLELTLGKYFFPRIKLPEGVTADGFLRTASQKGLSERYDKVTSNLQQRLDYELDVITKKNYTEYFLIFHDMAKWAADKNIPINTRGSVAGSLVSYSLGITTVDPIRYLLPFERFLNPFRPSAPDIDMDIADDRREEMLEYLREKYGEEKVAQICTFGRMLARASVRDVARVLGYPYGKGDKIAKLIPPPRQGFPINIDKAMKMSAQLESMYESDPDARKILDLARQIEGNARHISVHAAGVVISPTELEEFTPVQFDKPSGGKVITQYEMHSIEDVGLVKLDVLGIRNLSILRGAMEIVEQTRGETVDITKIPLDDKKTFEMLSKGETMGTFQMGSSGMTRYLVELKPEKIEDIMIMVALYRPGPMENIGEYIARKHGKKKVTYYHPKMEKFLDKSLGVLVYQDDLLYTAIEVAGYGWAEADKFRKAVGKKIPEEMAKQHLKFVEGCMEHSGMSKKEAEGLWRLFEPFQGYGFNKAHAASYGMLAYQTSYMKANYPVEYMTSLMTAESGDTDKISLAVNEAKRMGVVVLPPDINESDIGFRAVEDKESLGGRAIRFGLSAIKNVGEAAIVSIIEARKKGNFLNFADFCSRVDARKVNKKVLESLIKVGALSSFGTRAGLLSSMDEVRGRARPKESQGQQGLFSGDEEKVAHGSVLQEAAYSDSEFSAHELEELEKQLLGFSISAEPVEEILGAFSSLATHKCRDISPEITEQAEVKIAGVIKDLREITTKTNQEMAFATIEDDTGSADLVIFPRVFEETRSVWRETAKVLVTGKVNERHESYSVLVDKVVSEDSAPRESGELVISVNERVNTEKLGELRSLLLKHSGSQRAKLVFEAKGRVAVPVPFGIAWSQSLSREIASILS